MNRLTTIATAAAALATTQAAFSQVPAEEAAAVGRAAPPLGDHVTWLKGEPIKSYEPGTVYVLDFWATWCAPCIANMPHLNDLAKEYADEGVEVLAIAVWQDQAPNAPTPKAFLAGGTAQMDFNVAHDETGWVAERYMEAQGLYGIPETMVVDRQGRLAWHGHPQAGLAEVLGQVVRGEYDLEAEAARQDRFARGNAIINEANQSWMAADYDTAFAKIDEALAIDPVAFAEYGVIKFQYLVTMEGRAEEAYRFAWGILEPSLWEDAANLDSLAWGIVDMPGLASRDLELALKAIERARELTKDRDPSILDTAGRVRFEMGELAQAVELGERAVALGKERGAAFDLQNEMQRRLETYKEAIKNKP